jgi:molybdenum cofactor guanylyltransferase
VGDKQSGPISAVVVAGGKSQRLGQDKRRLRLWGQRGPTLLEHTIMIMAACCDEVIAVLNDDDDWPDLPARVVPDLLPNGGSLGGIYSGLMAAKHPYSFVVAADMPLLNHQLVAWMANEPCDYDVLVPRLAGGQARNRLGVESLHAIYGVTCREPMRRQLERGDPRVIGFFPEVRIRFVEPEILSRFDPAGLAFKNINTPEDLEEVRELIRD